MWKHMRAERAISVNFYQLLEERRKMGAPALTEKEKEIIKERALNGVSTEELMKQYRDKHSA